MVLNTYIIGVHTVFVFRPHYNVIRDNPSSSTYYVRYYLHTRCVHVFSIACAIGDKCWITAELGSAAGAIEILDFDMWGWHDRSRFFSVPLTALNRDMYTNEHAVRTVHTIIVYYMRVYSVAYFRGHSVWVSTPPPSTSQKKNLRRYREQEHFNLCYVFSTRLYK